MHIHTNLGLDMFEEMSSYKPLFYLGHDFSEFW